MSMTLNAGGNSFQLCHVISKIQNAGKNCQFIPKNKHLTGPLKDSKIIEDSQMKRVKDLVTDSKRQKTMLEENLNKLDRLQGKLPSKSEIKLNKLKTGRLQQSTLHFQEQNHSSLIRLRLLKIELLMENNT